MRTSRSSLLWLCFFFWLLSFSFAYAQSYDKAAAKARFEEAERHFKLQEYSDALDDYKDVYRVSGKAEILFNIAQCYRKLGRLQEALDTYETFLRDVPQTPLRKDVEAVIKELKVAIEEEKKLPPANPNLGTSNPTSNPVIEDEPKQGRSLWIGAGALGGLGLAAGGFALQQGVASSDLAQDETIPTEDVLATLRRAKISAWTANVLFVGAASMLGAAVYVSRTRPAEVSLLPSSGGATLSVRF